MSVLALVAKAAEEHGKGTHRGSKGSSKGKWKPGSGYESEIVSRLSTLCISMDRRLQALEDRASYVCIIKKRQYEQRRAHTARCVEDEKQRKEEHEADKSKPRRKPWKKPPLRRSEGCCLNYCRGTRENVRVRSRNRQ